MGYRIHMHSNIHFPTGQSRKSRQTGIINVAVDPLAEIAGRGLVARNTGAVLTNNVRALEQLMLNIRAIIRQTQSGVHAGDIDVVEGDVGAGALV